MRTLVELCSTLEDVPEERHIFMRLSYNVSTLPVQGLCMGSAVWPVGFRATRFFADTSTHCEPSLRMMCPRSTSRPTLRRPARRRPMHRLRHSPSA